MAIWHREKGAVIGQPSADPRFTGESGPGEDPN